MKYVLSWLKPIFDAARSWLDDDASLMAAAVSYYAALSFFPLLLVLIAGLGWVLQTTAWGLDAQTQILAAVEEYTSAAVSKSVAGMLNQVKTNAAVGGPLGILGLVVLAATLFTQFERAFDKIWHVPRPSRQGWLTTIKRLVLQRGRSFLMVVGVGILLLLNLGAEIAVASIRSFARDSLLVGDWPFRFLQTLVSITLSTIVFGVLFWVLPKASVRFLNALRGGLMTAILWTAGQSLLTSVLVGDRYSAYGVIGSFIALLVWIYYANCVIFFGAEYVQALCHSQEASKDPSEEPSAGERAEAGAR